MGWVKTKAELDAHYALRVREFNGAKMLGVWKNVNTKTGI